MALDVAEAPVLTLEERVRSETPILESSTSGGYEGTSPTSYRQQFLNQYVGRTPSSLTEDDKINLRRNGYSVVTVKAPETFEELEVVQQDEEAYAAWMQERPITGIFHKSKKVFRKENLVRLPTSKGTQRWTVQPFQDLYERTTDEPTETRTELVPESQSFTYALRAFGEFAGRAYHSTAGKAVTGIAMLTMYAGHKLPAIQQGATLISVLLSAAFNGKNL